MNVGDVRAIASSATPETLWRTFVIALLGATVAPMLFFPASVNFHRSATSVAAISAFINFLGSGAHVAATGFFYADPEVRGHFRQNKWRYFLAPAFLVVGTGVAFALADAAVSAYILLAYFAWQTYHYQKQNFGILSFVTAATDRIRPTPIERCILQLSVTLGILGLVKVYGLARNTVLQPFAGPIFHFAADAFWIVPVLLVAAFLLSPPLRRNPARVLFLAVGALFFAPTFLFGNPVAAILGYAIAHGLQYLVFMYFVGASKPDRDIRVLALAAIALAGGVALTLMGDRSLWGAPAKFIFGSYLGLVMSHFVIDAGIWKLREPFPWKYMGHAFGFVFLRGQSRAPARPGATPEGGAKPPVSEAIAT